jgi:hypothetical protein
MVSTPAITSDASLIEEPTAALPLDLLEVSPDTAQGPEEEEEEEEGEEKLEEEEEKEEEEATQE